MAQIVEHRTIWREQKELKAKKLDSYYSEQSQLKLTQNMDKAKL